MKKKILIAGAGGQLGSELQTSAPEWALVMPYSELQLDITDQSACLHEIKDQKPDWIINAAAYTNVDKAETEVELARRVNKDGAENLARAARSVGAGLIHISTDFVFSGDIDRLYNEEDEPAPLNVYGETKLAGEQQVQNLLFERAVIIRTSWLYSARGKNFLKTILRLLKENSVLTIVSDQVGVPTSVRSLSHVIYRAAELDLNGLFHWCDAGQCSWYDFACEIQAQALELGLLKEEKEIKPILTSDFPAKARRPARSAMNQHKLAAATGVDPLPWQNELKLVLQTIGN
jgi:dTDP-4-dehydrorhamnose reductase